MALDLHSRRLFCFEIYLQLRHRHICQQGIASCKKEMLNKYISEALPPPLLLLLD
jgi:hypothetical protein